MKEEYIIINKTQLLKRIEELENELKTLGYVYEEEIHTHGFISGEINQLKKILSQSTPLIPEIENSYRAGYCYSQYHEHNEKGEIPIQSEQDYISNLKLDI